MVNTLDLKDIGAGQARLYGLLSAEYPLPANASQFPLAAGQFYGQVATNCRLSDSKAASNKSFMARSYHVARSDITELAIVLPNWYWDIGPTKFELPNGAGVQFTCSVEYPAGTYTRLRFDDQTRGFCRDFEQLVSDFAAVTIPAGQGFWVNVWCLHTLGTLIFQTSAQNASVGEKMHLSTSSTTDLTMTAHNGNAQQTAGFWPTAVIGRTSGNPVLIVGDSLQRGIGDAPDAANAVGIIPRAIAPQLPYINIGSSGDRIHLFLETYKRRLLAANYTRTIIAAHGTNDIRLGRSAAQIKADLLTYWTLLRSRLLFGGKLFQCTLTHTTTSTDNWATTENQTKAQYFDTGVRGEINDWMRDGAPLVSDTAAATGTEGATRAGSGTHPLSGIFDVAEALETARNSGIWKVDGTAGKWTADGVHPSPFGYIEAAASGKIDLARLTVA